MHIGVNGLDELIKQAEELATGRELEATDRKAIKECIDNAKPIVESTARVSTDVMKSGRKGSRTGIHYKDVIKTKVGKKDGKVIGYVQVDDGKSNNSWFYSRFDEFDYGNSKYPPNKPFQKAFKGQRKKWDEIFKKYYEQLIKKLND
ncbi:HK97-gp10 family putative phage morphogenesis protein [Clostridium sp. Marseille-Q2269]|uniref:HK97-gp10 family putative phage morphogenesis protein n=1 Tax=Clostridium sp. Marseille-Q2269 TaxID=2942205 RepID=UPI0020745C9B|nr:HK97-gp10 family putative phage morphogenesis protein [Clostridium sp. Marseille-Q2269]